MDPHMCVTLVPLFNHLSVEEQAEINMLASHRHYQKNETIFQPGDEQLDIVARGSIKVYQLSANGKEQLLRVVEPGGYEGENQLFGLENETLFAEALEETEICTISKQAFNQVLLKNPKIAIKLFELSGQKMLQLEKQSQLLSIERVEERLANYLLDLVKVTETNQLTLSMKMKDIAQFLGTTPETLSRKFSLFESQGYISRTGKLVTILDLDGLQDM
ncbi:Crp/Fnr family transcriptional regulator [Streptococcus penaeicida]|uniref:Crp/Fnr family transcriptional regulator n=1 Tax=Streptococcus penaeicida TaxID=1765960 RepID=A0A2N8LAX6_9STRE|nr:Crp/Fnr family transcriptional regulator [Streptococcus penaeicida]PND47317.1 Crp/Fnr family transcriptional regulator [Streptococcus penaeicida]